MNGSERPQQNPRPNTQQRQERQPATSATTRPDATAATAAIATAASASGRLHAQRRPALRGELLEIEGLLDLRDDGYGFLRTKSYHPSPNDVYVSINQVRRYHCERAIPLSRIPSGRLEREVPALLRVDSVAGLDPEVARLRPRFEDLTPLFPTRSSTWS